MTVPSIAGGFAERVLQLRNIKSFNLDDGSIYRCSEEWLEATMNIVEPGVFKLVFDGHEFIIEKPTPQKVASILSKYSGVKSLKPLYSRVEYSPDLVSLRESILNTYRGSPSPFKISKKTYSRVFLEASRVRKIAAYEYVKYTSSKTIPEDILWTIYGDAFHRAVKILLASKSLINALATFKEALTTSTIKSVVRENDIVEAVKECEKALIKFMETELFRRYGYRYVRASPRVILIDDVAVVYATPDFRSVDCETIIDLKTFIPDRSREDSERVEKQMKIFQLAYPYAKAVIIAFPYREEYGEPYVKEYDPLSPYEALTYLRDLKNFCLEAGEELEVDFTRTETVRYLVRDDGFTLEVYDLDSRKMPAIERRPRRETL